MSGQRGTVMRMLGMMMSSMPSVMMSMLCTMMSSMLSAMMMRMLTVPWAASCCLGRGRSPPVRSARRGGRRGIKAHERVHLIGCLPPIIGHCVVHRFLGCRYPLRRCRPFFRLLPHIVEFIIIADCAAARKVVECREHRQVLVLGRPRKMARSAREPRLRGTSERHVGHQLHRVIMILFASAESY